MCSHRLSAPGGFGCCPWFPLSRPGAVPSTIASIGNPVTSYRYRTDENCSTPVGEALRRYDRVVAGVRIAAAVAVVLISGLMVAYHADATQVSEWQVTLTRGTSGTFVATAKAATPEAALQACHLLVPNAATTRTQFTCNPPRRVYIVTANPVTCPAVPAPRPGTCPAGTSGTWTQTATVGPAPTCTVTWSSAPTGACTPLTAPTGTTLSWTPPTHFERVCMRDAQGNEVNCVGGGLIPAVDAYRITYNTSGGSRPQVVQVPGIVTRHSLSNLPPGDWYFSVKAVIGGNESAPSNVIARTIR